MKARIKEIVKLLAVPLGLLSIYLSAYLIWQLLGLPSSSEELLPLIRTWFVTYGLWVVFFGALIEGFLLLGQYFPGGFVVFIGVIAKGRDISGVASVVMTACLAFFIAYTLNYLVGRYGWHKLLIKLGLATAIEKTQEKLKKHIFRTILFSYWEPNFASITATASGILEIPLIKFSLYSAIAVLIWNISWGALVFALGESALELIGVKYISAVFIIWISILLFKKYALGPKMDEI